MIIYVPEGERQQEVKFRTSSDGYKQWLKSLGDVIRIIPRNIEDPDTEKYDENGIFYTPRIEVYNEDQRVNYHYLKTIKQEQIALDRWLSTLKADDHGNIRIA